MLYPNGERLQMEWIVDGLARKPYPRGRGETRVESTSGGLRV